MVFQQAYHCMSSSMWFWYWTSFALIAGLWVEGLMGHSHSRHAAAHVDKRVCTLCPAVHDLFTHVIYSFNKHLNWSRNSLPNCVQRSLPSDPIMSQQHPAHNLTRFVFKTFFVSSFYLCLGLQSVLIYSNVLTKMLNALLNFFMPPPPVSTSCYMFTCNT